MRHRRARRSRALAAAPLLPFANAEPARCRKVPTDNSTAAASSRFDYGERYLDIVKCGGLSLLVSRLQPNLKEMAWVTIARLWHNGERAGLAARILPPSWNLGHNAATVCVNGTLHVFGGQYRNYTVGRGATARGVFHAAASTQSVSDPAAIEARWTDRSLQFEGWHKGCVERRTKFSGYCEFDGQFSAVYFNGRFLLYGRANLAATGGARHVQMTSAPADLSSWSPFKVVHLPGVKAGRADSNIYFFQVQVYGDKLLALFPAVFPAAAGVYASTSTDGIEWTRPQLLLRSTAFCARTRLHPVRLVGDQLYVFNNVDLSEPLDIPKGSTHARGTTRPYLQRLTVDTDEMQLISTEKVFPAVGVRVLDRPWQVVPVEGTDGVASIDPVATNGRAGNGKKAAFNAAPKEASPLPALSSATNARIASFLERVQALNDANATKASVALAVV